MTRGSILTKGLWPLTEVSLVSQLHFWLMNFNVLPICLDALVEIFYTVRTVFSLSSLFSPVLLRHHPPPPTPHIHTPAKWSLVVCTLFTFPLAHTRGRDRAYVPPQADARAGSAERVSPHSSDVRLEPKMGQACSHTSFICSAQEQQRKEAHFL